MEVAYRDDEVDRVGTGIGGEVDILGERPDIRARFGGEPASAIARMDWRSPREAAAEPASMTWTPTSARCVAISSFSAGVRQTPGVCSPSRKVVSKKRIDSPNKTITHSGFHRK